MEIFHFLDVFGEATHAEHQQELNQAADQSHQGRRQEEGHAVVDEAVVDDDDAALGVDLLVQGRDRLLAEEQATPAILALFHAT